MRLEDFEIIKDKTLITCDNETCPIYGDFWRCYNGNERTCGIYLNWEKEMLNENGKRKS